MKLTHWLQCIGRRATVGVVYAVRGQTRGSAGVYLVPLRIMGMMMCLMSLTIHLMKVTTMVGRTLI